MIRSDIAATALSLAAIAISAVAVVMTLARGGDTISARELTVVDAAGRSRVTVRATSAGATLTLRSGAGITTVSVSEGTSEVVVERGGKEPSNISMSARADGARLVVTRGDVVVTVEATEGAAAVTARRGGRELRGTVDGTRSRLQLLDGATEADLVAAGEAAHLTLRGPGGSATIRAGASSSSLELAGTDEAAGTALLEARDGARRLVLSRGEDALRVGVSKDGLVSVVGESSTGTVEWAPVAVDGRER